MSRKLIAIASQLDAYLQDETLNVPTTGYDLVKAHTSAAESVPILIDLSRSHGAWVFDGIQNQTFLDFHGGFGSDPFGKNSAVFDTPLAKKLLMQAAQNKIAHSDFSTQEYVTSVSLIWNHYVQHLGPEFKDGHLHLIDGGSMAMNQAIAAAIGTKVAQNRKLGFTSALPFQERIGRAAVLDKGPHPVGQMVISLNNSFHGRDGLTASLSHGAFKLEALPKLNFQHAEAAYTSDATEINARLTSLENKVKALGPELAAVVIEDAIQCEGGDLHIPVDFYKGLRLLADTYGFFVIYDGVQTGFYSSGDPAAFLTIGAPAPDIYVTAKKASVGVVVASTKMANLPDSAFKVPGKLDSTFGGDSVCVARFAIAAAAMRIPEFRASMKARYETLKDGLADLAKKFPTLIKETRALGTLLTIQTVSELSAAAVIEKAFHHHLLLLHSRDANTVRLRPNLNIQDDEVSEGLRTLETVFETLLQQQTPTRSPAISEVTTEGSDT